MSGPPWSVVAVAEKTEKDGAVRVWLAGVAGVCSRLRHRGGSPAVVPIQPGHPRGTPGITRAAPF